jgi:hypothetical protein
VLVMCHGDSLKLVARHGYIADADTGMAVCLACRAILDNRASDNMFEISISQIAKCFDIEPQSSMSSFHMSLSLLLMISRHLSRHDIRNTPHSVTVTACHWTRSGYRNRSTRAELHCLVWVRLPCLGQVPASMVSRPRPPCRAKARGGDCAFLHRAFRLNSSAL